MSGDASWHPEPELLQFRDPSDARAALERLGESAWAASLDFLYGEAMRRPVGTDTYPELRRRFFAGDPAAAADPGPSAAPLDPHTSAELIEEFRERVAPYGFNAAHPRSFSYFTPPPLPISIVGELFAQWMNLGVDVWHAGPIGALVEEEVVSWLRDLVGFGDGSFGVLTSGGVMANVMGLTVARDVHLAGLVGGQSAARGAALERARVYASDQAHFSVARALRILGFPAEALHVLASDERFRLRAETLAEAVAADRARGLVPFAVTAVAGSTNTGSVDRTDELADVSEREGLWLHVDVAYGGAARFSSRDAGRVPGLERADSITIDPHKWFFQAYDIGGLLVRRREDLINTFHHSPEYYRTTRPEDHPLNWYEYSMEGTRRFRALKLWMSWKYLGTSGFARLIEANNDLAEYLADRCADSEDFEALPSKPDLSVVCFRHLPEGRDAADMEAEALDRYQDLLQRALEISGEGWVSTTRLRGRTYLRAGVVNFLSTEADVDQVLDALRRFSKEAAVAAGLA